ncbi:57fae435-51e9-499a-a262-35fa7ac167fe-CDS [Sclerotinia trifoliorum]|uniref:57fae435-51e9-499a-a262-35fa7ac167fe-CDS n=1 Tax=Sclerotinia trifoliorum TaxID=28548 RepID=A0A8H2ZR88_9HELO|nr:57fae435-51e9-499a-a262-35fa7ac167fe-CDS [Sclerotinia trifoliorum]
MSTVMPDSFHPSESFQLRVPSIAHVRRIRSNSVQHRNSSSISSDEEFTRLNEEMFRLDAPYGEDAPGLFTWLLLAGYMVLPATFTSLQNSRTVASEVSKAGKLILKTYQNLPLLWIAAIFCAIGASGMSWLWWMWKRNYIWILNRTILLSSLHYWTPYNNYKYICGSKWSLVGYSDYYYYCNRMLYSISIKIISDL